MKEVKSGTITNDFDEGQKPSVNVKFRIVDGVTYIDGVSLLKRNVTQEEVMQTLAKVGGTK